MSPFPSYDKLLMAQSCAHNDSCYELQNFNPSLHPLELVVFPPSLLWCSLSPEGNNISPIYCWVFYSHLFTVFDHLRVSAASILHCKQKILWAVQTVTLTYANKYNYLGRNLMDLCPFSKRIAIVYSTWPYDLSSLRLVHSTSCECPPVEPASVSVRKQLVTTLTDSPLFGRGEILPSVWVWLLMASLPLHPADSSALRAGQQEGSFQLIFSLISLWPETKTWLISSKVLPPSSGGLPTTEAIICCVRGTLEASLTSSA